MSNNSNTDPALTQKIIDTLVYLQKGAVAVPEGHQVSISKRPPSQWEKFQAISPLGNPSMGTIDIFDILEGVSKGAFKTFNLLKAHFDRDNGYCVIPVPYTSKGSQIVFSRLVKELKDANLVRKVPQRIKPREQNQLVYMINPEYIKCFNYHQATEIWDQLK